MGLVSRRAYHTIRRHVAAARTSRISRPQALLSALEADLRRMLLPNTAVNLRESKRNQLKDFVSVAGPLGVSHFVILTATDSSSYMRIAKTPRVRAPYG